MDFDVSYESIMPTAVMTAYPLIYTDIPLAREMYEFLNTKNKTDMHLPDKIMAPQMEARQKLTDKILHEECPEQVFEFAAGFSTRGYNFCKNNKNVKYVELDLPQNISMKREFLKYHSKPINLDLIAGNALDGFDFLDNHFKPNKKTAVISHGLLRYLNRTEKHRIFKNVAEILKKHGGVWITCDISSRQHNIRNFKSHNSNDIYLRNYLNAQKFSNITKRHDMDPSMDADGMHALLENHNMVVKKLHRFNGISEFLTSPKTLGFDQSYTEDLLCNSEMAEIRLP
jgi:O-methyltransferase involved in polyketide biosynthesis